VNRLGSSGLIVVASMVMGMTAGKSDQPSGVTRTEVGRGTVAASYTVGGDAGTDVVVQSVTIQPGAAAPWHTHPGPEVGIIKSGTLTWLDGDDPKCAAKTYTAGQVVVGPGHVHEGRNLGSEPVEIVVSYFNVPPGAPATTPADRPAHCPA
jgi:quercetin dioxygenase-like cupin family protein